MKTNNLRSRREELEMTQQAVADAIEISQQHLQRLETGSSPVRLPIAEKIAEKLSCSIEELFPQLADMVRRDHEHLARNSPQSRKMIDEWEQAGIDIDAGYWSVRWHIAKQGSFFAKVSGATARRLIDQVEGKAKSGFLVFDSDIRRYAVALHDDVEMEFQRDPEPDEMAEATLTPGYRRVTVYSSGRNSYREFYVDPDEVVLYQHPQKRQAMQALFLSLETGNKPRVSIVNRHEDQTNDEASIHFIPVGSILSVEAPLSVVDPVFRRAIEDGGAKHDS
jgi:DNA-binding XRE family transcriptional regulator